MRIYISFFVPFFYLSSTRSGQPLGIARALRGTDTRGRGWGVFYGIMNPFSRKLATYLVVA